MIPQQLTDLGAEPMTSTLTELCGPHCGTKDGLTGHCPGCHEANAEVAAVVRQTWMAQHLRGAVARPGVES